MRVSSPTLLYRGAGWLLASTDLRSFLLYGSASSAHAVASDPTTRPSERDDGREGNEAVPAVNKGDSTHQPTIGGQFKKEASFQPAGRFRDENLFTSQKKQGKVYGFQTARAMSTSCTTSEDLLLVLAEDGKWQDLVTMLTGSPATHNVENMADCFRWLGRSGNQKPSIKLFKLLKYSGVSDQKLTHYLQIYTSACAEGYGAEQALMSFEAVEEMVQVQPNCTLFGDLINHFCGQGQVLRGLDLLEEMLSRGLKIWPTTFSPILVSLCDKLMLDEAFETMEAMRRLKVKPSLTNYNSLIRACVRAGNMEKAYGVLAELLQQGIHPNAVSFQYIMKGFSQQKRLKRAVSVLREMDNVGVKPDKYTYRVLLQACGLNNDLKEAQKLLKDVKILGLETDPVLLSAIIQLYVDNAKLDDAVKMVENVEMKGTCVGVDAKGQLVRGFALAGRLEEALKVYQDLGQIGQLPTPQSVSSLLVALGKVGRMDVMSKIFEETRRSSSWDKYPATYRTNFQDVFCSHLCLGYIRHKKLEEAVQFLRHVSELDITNDRTLYDKIFLLIASHGSEGVDADRLDASDGLALVRALKAQGIQPSRLAHEALFDACTSVGDSGRALEVVKEMEMACLPLNILSKVRIFRVFVAARNDREAEQVLEKITKSAVQDWDVRLLLQKIVQLELEKSEGILSRNDASFNRLLAIQKRLQRLLLS